MAVPLPLQGKSVFLIGDPGRRSRTRLPWAGIRSPFRGKNSMPGENAERKSVYVRFNSTTASTEGLRPDSKRVLVAPAFVGIVRAVTDSSEPYSMQRWQSSVPHRGNRYQIRQHVFSLKGMRIPAQGQRVIERHPGFRFRAIVGALNGHGNAMIVIRFKQ